MRLIARESLTVTLHLFTKMPWLIVKTSLVAVAYTHRISVTDSKPYYNMIISLYTESWSEKTFTMALEQLTDVVHRCVSVCLNWYNIPKVSPMAFTEITRVLLFLASNQGRKLPSRGLRFIPYCRKSLHRARWQCPSSQHFSWWEKQGEADIIWHLYCDKKKLHFVNVLHIFQNCRTLWDAWAGICWVRWYRSCWRRKTKTFRTVMQFWHIYWRCFYMLIMKVWWAIRSWIKRCFHADFNLVSNVVLWNRFPVLKSCW